MYTNPITHKKHRSWTVLHREVGRRLRPAVFGEYSEITWFGGPIIFGSPEDMKHRKLSVTDPVAARAMSLPASAILQLFRPALEAEYAEFDRKGRGTSLNHDLYGYDPAQGVAVIQARQYYKRAARHYGATRKTYFLCGRNEITGQFFRHPISAHTVRAACRKSTHPTRADVVAACQRWMWQVTEKQLANSIRQGDVLLVPEKPKKGAEPFGTTTTVGGSHKIMAAEIRKNGRIYALDPIVVHAKGQHRPVEVSGWYSVRVAREAEAWDFAERIGD